MDGLIPVINKLQDVFNAVGADSIDLPQIVVVGSQSSGKSSVLENIVGRDFLPRGSGIVTRRPLVLQLINIPWDGKPKEFEEWGEFLHLPGEIFHDFRKIKEEIERETERLVGKNKGVSPVPINLKIYSPRVLNLTLVDLPGITRVPVGDQPSDIEAQLRRMILSYIEKPNSLILAVTPANTDLTNSDALQLARSVDADGTRTIGVVSKIDLMDKGTHALDILQGRVVPLKLGFVGVVNRSQQDIITEKSIQESLKDEQKFFANHPLYKPIAHKCGTPYLAKTLNKLLMNHIRNCLPDLKIRINKMLQDAKQELQSYGDPLYDTHNSQGALLLQILTKFASDYKDTIDGKLTDKLSVNELYGGARINYIFFEVFGACLYRMDPLDGLTLNDIRTAIKNASGPRTSLFVPEVSFELLVKKQIERLLKPSLQCVDLVYDELQRIVSEAETKELLRFNNLRERVIDVMNMMLQRARKPTIEMIQNLINIELAFINTSHPDFVGSEGAITQVIDGLAEKKYKDRQSIASVLPVSPSAPTTQPSAPTTPANTAAPVPVQPVNPQQQSNPYATDSQARNTHAANGQTAGNNSNFFSAIFGKQTSPASTPSTTNNTAARKTKSGSVSSSGAPQNTVNSAPVNNNAPNPYSQSPTNQSMLASSVTQSTQSLSNSGYRRRDRLDEVPSVLQAGSVTTDREQFETELIRSLLVSYFNIVRKNIQDTVPKSVMQFLVSRSKNDIQNELVKSLYKEELFDELLEESPAIASRRKACKQMVDMLSRAQEILNEVRDFNIK
eukprot:TRINITY_DN2691_c0_g1_i1.p1 TRINITY_DN2691_c0_g1~~TRINITY_DN2691_c0_g1_i1.p1  ORF type:complete len:787 (-),score=334.88 TRINITY_DN2691_c0_g1_i1:36-2396(-)